jgi:tetratricopeptide (TPR) repeat protein
MSWAGPIEDYQKFLESQGGRGGTGMFAPLFEESMAKRLRQHLIAADRYFAAGQLNLAVREVETASTLAPGSMSIAVALAELYNKVGRHEEAIKIARVVLEEMPQSVQPHDIIGTAYLGMNKPELAAKEYQQVVRSAPETATGYHHLGDAYWSLGKPRQALAQYEEARKHDPRATDIILKSAAVLQELGRNLEAIERARHALELAPQDALARAILGNAHLASGDYDQAEAQYLIAIKLQPKFTYFWERLGELYVKTAPAKAVSVYRQILSRDPAHLVAHQKLAGLYKQENKPALAEYHWGFVALAGGRQREAIKHYRAALRHDPRLKGAYLDLATIYLKQKDTKAAAAAATKALDLDSTDATAYSILGQSMSAEGNKAEAEQHFKQAIQSNQAYWPAYLQLGDLVRAQNRCKEAVVLYEKAIRLAPQRQETYRKLGDCYISLGRNEEATQAYRKAERR